MKNKIIVERALLIDEVGHEEIKFAFYSIGAYESLTDITDIPEIQAKALYTLLKKHFERKEDDK